MFAAIFWRISSHSAFTPSDIALIPSSRWCASRGLAALRSPIPRQHIDCELVSPVSPAPLALKPQRGERQRSTTKPAQQPMRDHAAMAAASTLALDHMPLTQLVAADFGRRDSLHFLAHE